MESEDRVPPPAQHRGSEQDLDVTWASPPFRIGTSPGLDGPSVNHLLPSGLQHPGPALCSAACLALSAEAAELKMSSAFALCPQLLSL